MQIRRAPRGRLVRDTRCAPCARWLTLTVVLECPGRETVGPRRSFPAQPTVTLSCILGGIQAHKPRIGQFASSVREILDVSQYLVRLLV